MNIIVVGLSHNTAPVEIREKLSFPEEVLEPALRTLLNSYGVHEGVIISTCNRVEVVAATSDIEKGTWGVKRFLAEYHNIPFEELEEHLYQHTSEEAMRHLFKVSAGLDSMVLGEPQILGQVKDAYSHALKHNAAGVIINKLFHKNFSVAKRIRTETNIGSSAVSISYAAVELAKKIFGTLDGKGAMLVGAGEMAELAARHLLSNGVREVIVANRTYERAVAMARGFDGTAIMFREYTHYLKNVDIVITSTGASRYLITPDQLSTVIKERKNRPMFLIDISVPRNIDPRVNEIDNVYLYDIDDLSGVVAANMKERESEAELAKQIIEEEIENFYRWVKSLDVVPTIIALRKQFEEVRRGELDKALAMLEGLGKKERKIIESMSSAIINKALHGPVTHLKKEANKVEGDFYIEAARKLFDLGEDEETTKEAKEG